MTTTMMTIMTTHNDDDDEAQHTDKEKCNVFNVNIVFFSLYSILIVSDNGSTFLFFVTVTGKNILAYMCVYNFQKDVKYLQKIYSLSSFLSQSLIITMGFSFQTQGNLFKVFLLLEGSNQFFIIIGSHLIDFFM